MTDMGKNEAWGRREIYGSHENWKIKKYTSMIQKRGKYWQALPRRSHEGISKMVIWSRT